MLRNLTAEQTEEIVLNSKKISLLMGNKKPIKIIIIPNRIVNVVL